ncbi:uncharacterized protein LOC142994848 [Genypterus blacodes]|uniref:uncharacterized protein LOC142994848 n=1 Tax=Genypterus blacodes TaxID=154954 RepID=UPI003F75AAF5
MAFANLFTTLRVVSEDRSESVSAFPPSSTSDRGRRGRKRTNPSGRNDYYKKSRLCQAQTSGTNGAHRSFHDDEDYSNFTNDHTAQRTVDGRVGFTQWGDVMRSQSREAEQENMRRRGQNNKTNGKKQWQQRKKTEEEENRHWQKNRREPANRRGRGQTKPSSWNGARGDRKQAGRKKPDVPVERKRTMTQEFMEQNALVVDGRVLCRHFLWGKCIKADSCQLEHIQGYNDLIKEICKFYVQGFCSKGPICPYMHNSFPCKFFHAMGKCTQGAGCKFSHEPLSELTKQLLDEALKRDHDLRLANKAAQDASEPPANADEPATPDALTLPIRPNLYNSTGPHAEEDGSAQTEGEADVTEDAATPGDPTADLPRPEPLCYSVEALIEPQISKPFPSFYTRPKAEEPATLSDTRDLADNPTAVPYSVEAVLRSHKDAGDSSLSYSPTLSTTQTVSYSPYTAFPPVTYNPLRSAYRNAETSHLSNTAKEPKTSRGNSLNSLSNSTLNPSTKSGPDLPLTSPIHKEQSRDTPESQRAAGRGTSGLRPPVTELHNTNTDWKVASQSKTETQKHRGAVFSLGTCRNDAAHPCKPVKPSRGAFHTLFSGSPGQTSTPPNPAQTKARVSSPSPIASQRSALAYRPSTSSASTVRTVIQQPLSGPEAGPQTRGGAEATADSGGNAAHCVESSDGRRETVKRRFHDLFARPITNISQSVPGSAAETSSPPTRPTDRASKDVAEVESTKTTSRLFLGLFAAPLGETPAPPPLPRELSTPASERTSCRPGVSVGSSSSASTQRDSGLARARFKPISQAPASPDQPDTEKEENSSSAAVPPGKGSVLKTLFLSLSPYRADTEQQQQQHPLRENENRSVCISPE